eukprot:358262-Chlamydomonas_euryale.AAC.5
MRPDCALALGRRPLKPSSKNASNPKCSSAPDASDRCILPGAPRSQDSGSTMIASQRPPPPPRLLWERGAY